MAETFTITLRPQIGTYSINIGDKIKLQKGSIFHKSSSIKNRNFVYRLMKKQGQFIPILIVTFIDKTLRDFNFHLKPYNF